MTYTALARRYRSGQFDEVVGQEAIARTLQRAIETNRVAHAYLFTGTRGVGKTTMARLFAKALNTPGDKPPEVAKAIMEGRDTDVIEIDAASNRGVEEARELIANCGFMPMRGPYKIYIIDEVHMLTKDAFNTLLKTMEEPPSHVKFVLCTTETHKVPATIQSRCQRFDFRPISARKIAEHLKAVVQREGLKAEPAALAAVAREAAGSMRDALSLLDRLLASGEKTLTPALLEDLLGLPDRELIDALLNALAASDPKAALAAADTLMAQGVPLEQLLDALMQRLRDVLIAIACGAESELLDADADERAALATIAARFDGAAVVHMIALCENVQSRCKFTGSPRALLDALLVRLAMTERIADAAALASGAASSAAESPAKKAQGLPSQRPQPAAPGAAAPPAPADRIEPKPASRAAPAPAAPTDDPALVWQRVRDSAGGGPTRVMLDTLRLVSLHTGTAHIHADSAQALAYAVRNVERLGSMLTAAAGRPLRVALALAQGAQTTAPQQVAPASDPRLAAEAVPLVKSVMERFDARVMRVEDDPSQG